MELKNKRWVEYVTDVLKRADPMDGRIMGQHHAFKAGYEKGFKDAQQEDAADQEDGCICHKPGWEKAPCPIHTTIGG